MSTQKPLFSKVLLLIPVWHFPSTGTLKTSCPDNPSSFEQWNTLLVLVNCLTLVYLEALRRLLVSLPKKTIKPTNSDTPTERSDAATLCKEDGAACFLWSALGSLSFTNSLQKQVTTLVTKGTFKETNATVSFWAEKRSRAQGIELISSSDWKLEKNCRNQNWGVRHFSKISMRYAGASFGAALKIRESSPTCQNTRKHCENTFLGKTLLQNSFQCSVVLFQSNRLESSQQNRLNRFNRFWVDRL